MSLDTGAFDHAYEPGAIRFGRGAVTELGNVLGDRGLEDAVVVCGRHVGANRALMDPVESGLGDRLAAVFDETTPAKSIETAYDGVEAVRAHDADALVAVGAGSSIDTAKAISVLHADYRSLDDVRREVEATGTIVLPRDRGALTPLFAVPTTFAGADLSTGAGVIVPTGDGDHAEAVISDAALMPEALFYDPDCYETTPMGVLAGSAINGFDKAVESVYSRLSNPVTDATAVRALRYLGDALPRLRDAEEPEVMERAVVGIVLAQYGISIPGASKINVVHAFGHGLRKQFGVQQGVAHAVMVPHVLRTLFEHVDGRRDVLAEGLGVAGADDPAEAVVDAVVEVRDGLGLPARLGEVDGTAEDGIAEAARRVHDDALMERGPAGFDPSAEEIERAIRAAW